MSKDICLVFIAQEKLLALIRWEIAKAIAALGAPPSEPLPPDELDEEIEPRSLRYP